MAFPGVSPNSPSNSEKYAIATTHNQKSPTVVVEVYEEKPPVAVGPATPLVTYWLPKTALMTACRIDTMRTSTMMARVRAQRLAVTIGLAGIVRLAVSVSPSLLVSWADLGQRCYHQSFDFRTALLYTSRQCPRLTSSGAHPLI